ncbi:hypothetical protein ABK040_006736 [Willaertia magna]
MTDYFIEEGEILNSKYKLIIPTLQKPNSIYIWCHGYRPIGIPLTTTFDYYSEPYATLNRKGFILASLSYRREGYILKDAVEDIINLRNYIVNKYLSNTLIKYILLEAESMGGAIVTFLNERSNRNLFTGIIATGAALYVQKDPIDNPIQFLHTPHIPQIFLCNNSEISVKLEDIIVPACWLVDREGHCAVYKEEIQLCFYGLFEWIDNNKILLENDITLLDIDTEHFHPNVLKKVSKVEFIQNNETLKGAWVQVDEVTLYGEVILDITDFEFKKLHIYPYQNYKILISKESKLNNFKFNLNRKEEFNTFEIVHASFPYVGIDNNTWVSDFNMSNDLIIRKHFTGNNLNSASKEMNVQMGQWVFICEKEIPKRVFAKESMKEKIEKLKQII